MSVYVLLNLLNELEKRDKMRGLPSILSLSQQVYRIQLCIIRKNTQPAP